MVKNIINEFLYTGAGPGEKLATQQAVKNMSYGQIGKNILAEGVFGKQPFSSAPASSLRGYDPNYTGKGAIPRNTVFQRMTAPFKYAAGAFNLGDKTSNLAGGTPAQRQLYEKVLQSPVSKAGSRAVALGRTALGGPFGIASMIGTGLGYGADRIARATNTPEEYEAMKEAARVQGGTGYFDDIDISQDAVSPVGTNEPMDIEDFLGTSTPQDLGFIEAAPEVKEAIYQDRIMNSNLPGFMAAPSRFQSFKNQMSNFINNPVTKGLGTALNFARGSLPGMIMSGIGSLFSRNPNAPSYQTRSPNIDYSNLNTTNLNDFYDSNPDSDTFGTTRFDRAVPGSFGSFRTLAGYLNRNKTAAGKAAIAKEKQARKAAKAQDIARAAARAQQAAIQKDYSNDRGGDAGAYEGSTGGYNEGNYCFDPSTPIQMADGSTKEIKNIQLGDDTKGGEVTGVFQFKASDEIHDYKGVTVAGSHYVKEDGRFIMVKDSPISVKIDKIPVVYSLDTTGRRIFINDIEFADYNGDGVAKNFLTNAGVDLTGFNKEVLRQVEHRLI